MTGSEKWLVYHNGKSIPNLLGKTPLTDVNLAVVCRTILAPTSSIPARAGKFPFVFFFLKKVGNVLSVFIQKVQWIESKRNWEKTLINTDGP